MSTPVDSETMPGMETVDVPGMETVDVRGMETVDVQGMETVDGHNAAVMSAVAADQRLIRFVNAAGGLDDALPGDGVLLRFKDPAPGCAVLVRNAAAVEDSDDLLRVVIPPLGDARAAAAAWTHTADEAAPLAVKLRGVEVLWLPGRALLECAADQIDLLLPALVEFAYYERELRRMEQEIAAAWPELEEDKALAFDVTAADLHRSAVTGARMAAAFQRRIRFARMEAHLYTPDRTLTPAGSRLGEELRERAAMEQRAEAVEGQLDVFEHIYEMGSQRMGEFRASRQGNILEWVIVVLLIFEVLLMVHWRG